MSIEQLYFSEYLDKWPQQNIPPHWLKRLSKKRQDELQKKLVLCDFPQFPDVLLMQQMVKIGSRLYPPGHSRHRRDNPKFGDSVQLRFSKGVEFGLSLAYAKKARRSIMTLLEYGFIEQRIDSWGRRYRVSWLGLKWLQGEY